MVSRRSTSNPPQSGFLTRIKGNLQCALGNHEPDRHKVKRDGIFYVGSCQRCGIAIRKRNGRPWEPVEKPDDAD